MQRCVDEKLASAFHDVPIPAGLGQRLLDRLAAARVQQGAEVAAEHVPGQAARSALFLPAGLSRQWLLTGGGLLAVAASLLIAVWLATNHNRGLSEELVLNEAIRAFDAIVPKKGHLVTEYVPPTGYPISSAVIRVRGTSWRPLEGFLGHDGVIYELPGQAGTRAALYVLAAEDADQLGDTPTLSPFTTGGYCASAWQESGLLYVLVVQGDPATYDSYLSLPSEPVA